MGKGRVGSTFRGVKLCQGMIAVIMIASHKPDDSNHNEFNHSDSIPLMGRSFFHLIPIHSIPLMG